jgi:hypothetical protein
MTSKPGNLSALVGLLDGDLNSGVHYTTKIRHPSLLLSSLRELDTTIGNASLKESVVDQILYLLNLSVGDEAMLNAVIYGPPGVGKTHLGKILAKIWFSLGFLEKEHKEERKEERKEDLVSTELGLIPRQIASSDMWICGCVALTVAQVVWYAIGSRLNKGLALCLSLLVMFLVMGVLLWLYRQLLEPKGEEILLATSPNEGEAQQAEEIFQVVSREEFVGKYAGWTDKKTRALLEANLGKVLFIDEAYSLFTGEGDSYGREALNTLNKFLSEHPREIIVIFAGYHDLLQKSIFSAQPGLARRCMWHFRCEGYNGDELYSIFLSQAERAGWKIADPSETKKLFLYNVDAFKAYGGDTQRLLHYASLRHSRRLIEKRGPVDKALTFEEIKDGIVSLRENSETSPGGKESPISLFQQLLSS